MSKNFKILYTILGFMILARIFGMLSIPLTDTTEARYAHTALIMAMSGDWITPYYDLDIPFWGKPPFSFWMEAFSINIFGINDFSARFPALIFTLMSMRLIYIYVKRFHSKESALWAILIYFSFLLTYALSGAILTDPYLTFATTLSMISFVMLLQKQESYWGYLFFIGLAIGILAKGPLAIVLAGGSIFFWIVFDFKTRFMKLGMLPWFSGITLMLIISIPWYILAELKTPGFLDYFIIGEHYKRFVDSGWSGDLYGVAHKKFHGMIWLMWILSTLPWVFLVFSSIIKHIKKKPNLFSTLKQNSIISYFIMWSIFTMTFFTLSGNVLWTYNLPALPALAILIALLLEKSSFTVKLFSKNIAYGLILFIPLLLFIANIYIIAKPDAINSDKFLIQHYQNINTTKAKIYYIAERPFSAQYYSWDEAILVSSNDTMKRKSLKIDYTTFEKQLNASQANAYIVVGNGNIENFKTHFKYKLIEKFQNKNRTLFQVQ